MHVSPPRPSEWESSGPERSEVLYWLLITDLSDLIISITEPKPCRTKPDRTLAECRKRPGELGARGQVPRAANAALESLDMHT
jgi:hypothetical protein